ncbi:hypothetical protein [Natrialba aegyptia]|uniref:hypothetical protein n=1 Tax=Natrialba aegyptia TaxID=129789 RepID=UPI00403AADBC
MYADIHNSWPDPGDYPEYIYRIKISGMGTANIGGNDTSSILRNMFTIDVTGDVVQASQPIEPYAIGGYEYMQTREDDHDDSFYDEEAGAAAVVSGAFDIGIAIGPAILRRTVPGIIATMAFAYLTQSSGGESGNHYQRIWEWDDDIGQGVTESAVYADLTVRIKKGNTSNIDVEGVTTSSLPVNNAYASDDFDLTAPDNVGNLRTMNTSDLRKREHIRVAEDELSSQQKNMLLSKETREILQNEGELIIGANTVVGQSILELRKKKIACFISHNVISVRLMFIISIL